MLGAGRAGQGKVCEADRLAVTSTRRRANTQSRELCFFGRAGEKRSQIIRAPSLPGGQPARAVRLAWLAWLAIPSASRPPDTGNTVRLEAPTGGLIRSRGPHATVAGRGLLKRVGDCGRRTGQRQAHPGASRISSKCNTTQVQYRTVLKIKQAQGSCRSPQETSIRGRGRDCVLDYAIVMPQLCHVHAGEHFTCT